MKLDFIKNNLEFNGKKINFRDIVEVRKFDIKMYTYEPTGWFSTKEVILAELPIVGIQLYNSTFIYCYDNIEEFDKVLKCIKDKELYGIHHIEDEEKERVYCGLWQRIISLAFYKYGIDGKTYARNDENLYSRFGFDYLAYWKKSKSYDEPFEIVENVEEIYKGFTGVLPQNIEKTKEAYKEKEAKERVRYIKELCGENANDKDEFIGKLDKRNKDEAGNWVREIEKLKEYNGYLNEIIREPYYPKDYIKTYIELIEYGIKYSQERFEKIQEEEKEEKRKRIGEEIERELGPIEELKKILRLSIDLLKFDELVELYREYDGKERRVLKQIQYLGGVSIEDEKIKGYKDIYRLGKVLISDKLNQINKNKANTRYIAPEIIEEAMLFYYETSTVEEAKKVRSNEKYSQNKESGEIGEQKVEYALKWLDKKYVQIEKRSKDRVGNDIILLLNKEFIDEKQEYDHIVVSEKGVFNIETKNYAGKLEVDSNGNWKRIRGDQEEGLRNPLQQIRQHEKVLGSILPEGVNIISILCIANDKAIIEGTENCPIPIVKSDMLVEYIEKYQGTPVLSETQQKESIECIYKYMV